MKLNMTVRALLAVTLGAVALTAPGNAGAIDSGQSSPPGAEVGRAPDVGQARFEGRTIDLKRGWGEAKACHVDNELDVTCYRSERAMEKALGINAASGGDYPSAANGYATCGSSLKLYWGSYYNTPVLYMTVRGTWTTLSWFGSDNVISSYKMGSCGATFRSGSYGTGSTYPGPTWAWARRSTMGWGWNNVLSSLYIY